MNKITMVVLPVVLVFWGMSVLAQNVPSYNNSADVQRMMKTRYGATGGQMGMPPNIMSKEKIEKFMQSLFELGLLYKIIAQPTMVSIDNGIIVAYGNTLRKYDKDLNVIKEVNLDVNVDGMQELASKFAKKYSAEFMDDMGGMPGSPYASTSASPSTSTKASPSTSRVITASGSYDQREDQIKKEIDQMQ